MEKQELIRYRVFADALIRLNNAARTLLQEGADPDAIKLILTGTAKLFSELEDRMARAFPETESRPVDLRFDETSGRDLPVERTPVDRKGGDDGVEGPVSSVNPAPPISTTPPEASSNA